MQKDNNKLYKFRYEVASERKTLPGITLIPEADISASAEHISEHKKFLAIKHKYLLT